MAGRRAASPREAAALKRSRAPRAQDAPELEPEAHEISTVAEAVAADDTRETLRQLGRRIAVAIDAESTPARDLASLSRRLMEMRTALDTLDADDPLAVQTNAEETRETLRQLEARIAKEIDGEDTPARDLAALSRRLMEIRRTLDTLEVPAGDSLGDAPEHVPEVAEDEPFDAEAV